MEEGQEEEEVSREEEEEEAQDPTPLPEATEGAAVEESPYTATAGEQQEEGGMGVQTAPPGTEGRGLEP